MENQDKLFVENLLKALLNYPEDVEVTRSVDDLGVLMEVKVNKADMGILIGQKGQNVNAVRTLLRIIGSKQNERVNLKVVEADEILI